MKTDEGELSDCSRRFKGSTRPLLSGERPPTSQLLWGGVPLAWPTTCSHSQVRHPGCPERTHSFRLHSHLPRCSWQLGAVASPAREFPKSVKGGEVMTNGWYHSQNVDVGSVAGGSHPSEVITFLSVLVPSHEQPLANVMTTHDIPVTTHALSFMTFLLQLMINNINRSMMYTILISLKLQTPH